MAEIKAFAKAVASRKTIIFALQKSIKHLSLLVAFRQTLFQIKPLLSAKTLGSSRLDINTMTYISMKNIILTLIFILSFSFLTYGQASKENAIKNFESFFTSFKNAYPADKNKDSFKNYSDLKPRIDLPEELKMMVEYDTSIFYSQYLYRLKYLRDTLIKVASLNFDQSVKEIYSKFRQSIIDGEKVGQFNYNADKQHSVDLDVAIKKTTTPQIGYYQMATITVQPPKGKSEENKILIIYSNDLDIVEFSIIEK